MNIHLLVYQLKKKIKTKKNNLDRISEFIYSRNWRKKERKKETNKQNFGIWIIIYTIYVSQDVWIEWIIKIHLRNFDKYKFLEYIIVF